MLRESVLALVPTLGRYSAVLIPRGCAAGKAWLLYALPTKVVKLVGGMPGKRGSSFGTGFPVGDATNFVLRNRVIYATLLVKAFRITARCYGTAHNNCGRVLTRGSEWSIVLLRNAIRVAPEATSERSVMQALALMNWSPKVGLINVRAPL